MKLDAGQKLILTMLCDIANHLEIDNGLSPTVIEGAIITDNTWALDWEYAHVLGFEPEPTPQHVAEVTDILDMWSFLEDHFQQLDGAEKAELANLAAPYGEYVKFAGFDGNNESDHYSAAKFMIDRLGRFSHFAGRDMNSHGASVEASLRMYSVFEPLRAELGDRRLTVEEMAQILQARRHQD